MTATPAALTWSGVTARRMGRHALTEPATDLDPAAVAARLCGAHAQVLGAAELSIGRRIAGAIRADVQRALWRERTLVKTFGPRGTIHLLSAADLPMWTGALSALPSPVPIHPEGVRFSPGQADEVIAAIADALADAELTVDELTEALAARPGPWAVERTMEAFQDKWPRWRQLTSTAAHRGVLCFGPDRGRKVTYTNPHRWLPGFRPADADTALRTLVTRYLYAYGPATPQHFARWIGVPPRYAAGQLPIPRTSASTCGPVRWWTDGTVLASCSPPGSAVPRLWLVPVSGAHPTALTPPRNPRTTGDLGDLDAWQLPSGLYLQAAGPCGVLHIFRQARDGSIKLVTVPHTSGDNRVLTARGTRLLVQAPTDCTGSVSLLWYDPGKRAGQWLIKAPRNVLGVTIAVPFYSRQNGNL